MAMKHLYRIYPKRTIRGIRPQEIMEPTTIENLNRQEFLKCFNGGELYAIVNGEEVHIKECNYDKAESLFDVDDEDQTTEISMDIQIAEANTANNMIYSEESLEAVEMATDVETKVTSEETGTVIENIDYMDGQTDTSVTQNVNLADDVQDIIVTGNSDEKTNTDISEDEPTNAGEDQKTDDPQANLEVKPENNDESGKADDDLESEDDNKVDDQTVEQEKVIDEVVDKKEQQPQQYNKNHNKQQNQTNHRNQNNGKHNKGKFVINNK